MRNILIVDDDVIMNNSIKGILSETYRVSQLTSGSLIMDFLRKKETSLILLDVYMNGMDGREVLRAIKADRLTADIPVIIITGESEKKLAEECLELGAVDCVHKPIRRDVLEQRVESRLIEADSRRRIRQMYENTNVEAQPCTELIWHDDLTGLWNRQYIYEAFAQQMGRPDSQCSLAFINLDNFSYINQTFGHREGDELLRRFGGVLSELEETGVIPSRVGGDEFLLMLPDHFSASGIQQISDFVFEKASKQSQMPADSGVMTFSMGVAFAPEDGTDFMTVAVMADMALQKAKNLGKNRVYFAKNLQLEKARREETVNIGGVSLESALRGRESDKKVMTIQFGEMRILYRSLKSMPPEVADKIHAVMFTISPENSNPFDSGRLLHTVGQRLGGVVAVTKYAQNQILAVTYGVSTETLGRDGSDIVSLGVYGKVDVDVL